MPEQLEYITLESGKEPRHSIIWLHGLGADGEDFVPVAAQLQLPVTIRYLFPHAPKRPVTINNGAVMRAWYDITTIGGPPDSAGMNAAQAGIQTLIDQELERGIRLDNIFLAGFSQGGVIALLTALRNNVKLGGVLALSTYLPALAEFNHAEKMHGVKTPVFMAHGRDDPVIPCTLGATSRDRLMTLGYAVEWHEYAMQHSVNAQEIHDIQIWLTKKLT
ncbi:MAG TPA: carboxylesterase [Gallionella sp.]|nr:carboxylesterase [Gallionella sp.]